MLDCNLVHSEHDFSKLARFGAFATLITASVVPCNMDVTNDYATYARLPIVKEIPESYLSRSDIFNFRQFTIPGEAQTFKSDVISSNKVVFRNINSSNCHLVLRSSITLDIYEEEGYYYIDFPYLDIHAAGKTYDNLISDFNEEFAFAWANYAHDDDRCLSNDARALKQKLLSIVASEEGRV